jgi:hypothetical protein
MRADHAQHRHEPLGCAGGAEACHGAFAVPGRLMRVLRPVESSTDVKCLLHHVKIRANFESFHPPKDSAAKRAAVLKALNELQRKDRRMSPKVVVARAGVHRNVLQRHKDVAGLIDEAAGGTRADNYLRPRDRVSDDSLVTDLADANIGTWGCDRRCASLSTGWAHRVRPQDRLLLTRSGRRGASDAAWPQVEVELVDKCRRHLNFDPLAAAPGSDFTCRRQTRTRRSSHLQDDAEVLPETNRSLVREYGLIRRLICTAAMRA